MGIAGGCRGAMGVAGGYLAWNVWSYRPVSSVSSGQTGIPPGRRLSMRPFQYGRLGCPGDRGGGRSVHSIELVGSRPERRIEP
jgi:hypothetical protein